MGCGLVIGLLFIVDLLCYLEANSRTSGESILLRNKEGHPASEDEEREVEECDYRQQSHIHSEANSGESDSDKVCTSGTD